MRRLALAMTASLLALLAFGPTQASANHLCAATITQNTALEHDHFCTGNGIAIGASRITLDFGGFYLQGDSSGTDTGIDFNGFDGVTLAGNGGEVWQFSTGVLLEVGTARAALNGVFVHSNSAHGIEIQAGASGNKILGGSSSSNGLDGVLISGNRNVVDGLEINLNSQRGIALENFATANSVTNNTVLQSAGDGIQVDSDTVRTLVKGNASHSNGQNGIRVFSPKTTITGNSANFNTFWGIIATAGVRDGGGNTASGNGTGQCFNVAC